MVIGGVCWGGVQVTVFLISWAELVKENCTSAALMHCCTLSRWWIILSAAKVYLMAIVLHSRMHLIFARYWWTLILITSWAKLRNVYLVNRLLKPLYEVEGLSSFHLSLSLSLSPSPWHFSSPVIGQHKKCCLVIGYNVSSISSP